MFKSVISAVRLPSVFGGLAIALLAVGKVGGQVQSTPVERDPTIDEVSYAEFDGMAPVEVWHAIDSFEFWAIPGAPPAGYYNSINATTPEQLRATLHERIREHLVFPYTHSSKPGNANHRIDTWDIIALADAHPEHPDMVLDIYLNGLFPRQLAGTQASLRYDREHSWPKSLGFPSNTTSNPAYNDCHHLFAAFSSYNGSRSNKPYGEGTLSAEDRRPTLENLGRGGSLEAEIHSANYSFRDAWQTWLGRRGDVARALMYMDVRYEGPLGVTASEADLRLTDDADSINTLDAAASGGTAQMGVLAVLLRWHDEDPVDDLERRRNTVVYLFQGNRNPFVDHPDWVARVHGAVGEEPVLLARSWINEFHYDNTGADEGEFVEIAGPAGLDLEGWKLLGYNGSGGKVYRTLNLAGEIPDQQNGRGVLDFDFPALQNGPDGLALVDPTGRVVELLSYEGRFTATDGPAIGMIASDVGVEQSSETPVGSSIQLQGSGNAPEALDWEGPIEATRGEVNRNQTFED